jgi:hypothetical protein
MIAMKHTIILIGVLSVVGCVAVASARDGIIEYTPQTLQETLVGPYVAPNPVREISDYISPNNVCIIENNDTPIIDVINNCKKQRKGWLKI